MNPVDHHAYVEDVALFLEQQGLPRIAGRIVGLLLICDPPHRTAAQMAEELGASKGSISTMTRLLLEAGTIEKVAIPGERATHYVLSEHSLEHKLERQVQRMMGFLPLAERGLKLLEKAPENRKRRLRAVRAMYAFMQREVPGLLRRWREERRS